MSEKISIFLCVFEGRFTQPSVFAIVSFENCNTSQLKLMFFWTTAGADDDNDDELKSSGLRLADAAYENNIMTEGVEGWVE